MSAPERQNPVPAWSVPERGSSARWLKAELSAGAAALLGVAFLGLVMTVSAALRSPWPMVAVGGIGTGLLWRNRRSGRALRHALWIASLFLLIAGLFVLPFVLLARR